MKQIVTTPQVSRDLIAASEQDDFRISDIERHLSVTPIPDLNILQISLSPLTPTYFHIYLGEFLDSEWKEEGCPGDITTYAKSYLESNDWKQYALDNMDEWEVMV